MRDAEISIGMPTYNNARTIDRAIQSVLDQSYPNWKLYISDDFSDDATRSIIHNYAKSNPHKIFEVHPSERLYYLNFRHLIHVSEAPFFVWLAGDDWWEPDFLYRCLDELQRHPEAVCCVARCRFHLEDGSSHIDPGARALTSDMPARVSTYFLKPDQSRMYGIFRRDALKQSFVDKVFHAYDWALCAGTLRLGIHVGIEEVLLHRELTPNAKIVASVDRDEPNKFFRYFPVLRMTYIGLSQGIIPSNPKVLFALLHVNIVKHREQMKRNWPLLARGISPIFRLLLRGSRFMARRL